MHNDFIMHVFIMHVARTSLMHNNLIMHVFVMQFKNKNKIAKTKPPTTGDGKLYRLRKLTRLTMI